METEKWNKENEIKLDILTSLSISQKALARMIENMAEVTHSSKAVSEHLLENIQIISQYQRALAMKITGLNITTKKKGIPTLPWKNTQL